MFLEVTGTGIVFPGTISSLTGKELQLIGVGVRKMSVLKFKLYSIGLYVESGCATNLKNIVSVVEAQEIICSYEWALRIVPVRNGSMSHLRDALVRRLSLSEEKHEQLSTNVVQDFASLFPNAPMQMGSTLTFFWSNRRGLDVLRQDQVLGCLSDAHLSGKLLRIYLDKSSSSVPDLVRDIEDTFSKIP